MERIQRTMPCLLTCEKPSTTISMRFRPMLTRVRQWRRSTFLHNDASRFHMKMQEPNTDFESLNPKETWRATSQNFLLFKTREEKDDPPAWSSFTMKVREYATQRKQMCDTVSQHPLHRNTRDLFKKNLFFQTLVRIDSSNQEKHREVNETHHFNH